jgi:hypothetical protein
MCSVPEKSLSCHAACQLTHLTAVHDEGNGSDSKAETLETHQQLDLWVCA